MMNKISTFFIICAVCFPSLVAGTVTISFDPEKTPLTNSVDITCTLTGSSSNAVTWNFGSTTTGCGSGVCLPDPSPYTFSMSGNVFTLTLPSAAIGNCISYSCADSANNADTVSEDLFVAYFDKADIVPTEPGAKTDGIISVTTGCVLSPSDVTIEWYKTENGVDVEFTADRPSPVDTSDRSTCTRTCHSEQDEKKTNGFTHTEYIGVDSVLVQYKVIVKHKSYPDVADQYTWTSASYNIKGVCPKDCEDRVIASIVFGIFGIIALVVVIIGILKDFSKPVCLAVAVLCIVFDIISLALSASVLADDDCKDCEDWIHNSAIAFVVIPSIVAVTAIVLTILVLLGVIGPGRNANEAYQPGENREMPVRTQ